MAQLDHTKRAYIGLSDAYAFFNVKLFDSKLPSCLITLKKHKGAYGYFKANSYQTMETTVTKTDEICLNPQEFKNRKTNEVLSTLVHEMVHLWQQHLGDAPKTAYHNKQWALQMKRVGLQPESCDGKGKETGAKVSHKIIEAGAFFEACKEFLSTGEFVLYQELTNSAKEKTKKKKAESKTKFTCEFCGANAWAKKSAKLICGVDRSIMECEDATDNNDAENESEAA